MTISLGTVHSFLTHPGKGMESQHDIGGTKVLHGGKLWPKLAVVFERAPHECDIEVVFRPDATGAQASLRRDEMLTYLYGPTLQRGRHIAGELQAFTTNKSGMGLLFLMTGKSGDQHRLVLARFPADEGIIAEESKESLSVEFLERVFMKSARSYKSAIYESDSRERGFWSGKAVDKQISGSKELSDYWIRDFLSSELRTTGPAGTKRLANALKAAIRSADDLSTRQELIAAATLLPNRDGAVVTGQHLVSELALGEKAAEALSASLPRAELLEETFRFDGAEFKKQLAYRTIELDNGAVLMGPIDKFGDIFTESHPDDSDPDLVAISTQGHVVGRSLRMTK